MISHINILLHNSSDFVLLLRWTLNSRHDWSRGSCESIFLISMLSSRERIMFTLVCVFAQSFMALDAARAGGRGGLGWNVGHRPSHPLSGTSGSKTLSRLELTCRGKWNRAGHTWPLVTWLMIHDLEEPICFIFANNNKLWDGGCRTQRDVRRRFENSLTSAGNRCVFLCAIRWSTWLQMCRHISSPPRLLSAPHFRSSSALNFAHDVSVCVLFPPLPPMAEHRTATWRCRCLWVFFVNLLSQPVDVMRTWYERNGPMICSYGFVWNLQLCINMNVSFSS